MTMDEQKRERPARDTMLVFGCPTIGEEEIAEVVATLRSGWIGTGPRTSRFEDAFARYKGVPRAVALSSCTAALELSLRAAGIGQGDEVITTALTFCATVNAIQHVGATPVLADIDPTTMNLDPAAIEAQVTERTRGLVPVHFAGRPCEMDAILAIASRHALVVVEDCAHAIESTYHGKALGTLGDFGAFSFYVTKNVVTGEGGMVIARDPESLERIKVAALHGLSNDAWKRFSDAGYRHYTVTDVGFKYNMTDMQASLGIHQLARVEPNWIARERIWQRYSAAFRDLPIGLPAACPKYIRHAYHLYTLLVDRDSAGISRDDFLAEMTALKIGVGVHYLSLPEHPFYRERYGWSPGDYPNAMRIGRQTVSIPLSAGLTDEDVTDVICAVRRIIDT